MNACKNGEMPKLIEVSGKQEIKPAQTYRSLGKTGTDIHDGLCFYDASIKGDWNPLKDRYDTKHGVIKPKKASYDTSKFYVLGKNISENRICSLQMDRIEIRKDLPQTNKEFHNNKYYEIYNELFSSAFEDKAYRVKVLVSEFANVKKRFSDLMNVRSKTNAVL